MNPAGRRWLLVACLCLGFAGPARALYPDPDGVGACQFDNPFAGTSDCVQYTGTAWTVVTAAADCASLFSVPYANQFNPDSICSIPNHAADCVEELGTENEKVNLNNATDAAFCRTLRAICNSVLFGDYFPVPGSICDEAGPPPLDCENLEPEACAAMQSNEDVEVGIKTNFIDFTPLTAQRRDSSFILFPGGAVVPQAYAPLAQDLARAGIYTAILDGPDGTLVADVMNDPANGGVIYWLLAGHSLGGVTAVKYILANPAQIAGLGLLGSFPDAVDDMSGLDIQVVSVFGTNDLITTPAEALGAYPLLPPATRFTKIRGGNHAQFGYYGQTPGDGDAGTSPAKQQELTAAVLRNLVARVELGPGQAAGVEARALLNAASSDQGARISQLYASGFGAEGIPPENMEVFRTATIDEFISSKPGTSPGIVPEIQITQFLNQLGNPDDPGYPPIYDGEVQAKFLTQEKLEADLSLMTPNAQGSCVDVNAENVSLTRAWLEDARVLGSGELDKLDQWTWLYAPDVLFPTGPDFIADEASVVTVVIDDLAKTVTVQSPSFFATLDPSNGAAAGRHYCKVLGYERIYLVMRELISQTP